VIVTRSRAVADVLVVDDQSRWRAILAELVREVPGLKVVGEATCGEEALEAAQHLRPQLVLMDIRMPGIGGFEATRRLTAAHPDVLVLLVSIDGRDAAAVRSSGAVAVVRKQELSAQALRDAWDAHRRG
jgi:DNA-binding NarL/FixJ family response regulator